MSRAIERYVCSSEDRCHYDTEDIIPFGYYIIHKPKDDNTKPMMPPEPPYDMGYMVPCWSPHMTSINIINKTEITEQVSDEQIQEAINSHIPDITETVVNEIGDNISITISGSEWRELETE